MDMVEPAGMLGRSFRKGYRDLSEGDTTLTVTRPSPNDFSYIPMIVPNWNTGWSVTSFDLNQFTVIFQTPAPSEARVRWVIFT
jgi:hypothetical protein